MLSLADFIWWARQHLLPPSITGLLRGTDPWGHRPSGYWRLPHGDCPPSVIPAYIVQSSVKTSFQSGKSLNLKPNIAPVESMSICESSSSPELQPNCAFRDYTMLRQGPLDLLGPWLTPKLERCPWEAGAGLVRHLSLKKTSIPLPWISAWVLPIKSPAASFIPVSKFCP